MSARPILALVLPSLALGTGLASCRPATPRRYVVEMKDLAFTPAEVTVSPGDTIIWVDHDLFPHTATGDSGSGWEVGPLQPGGEGSYVPTKAGAYAYRCRLHPTMHGTIIARSQR